MGHYSLLVADSARGRVSVGPRGFPIVRYALNKRDVAQLHRSQVLAGELAFAAGARKLHPGMSELSGYRIEERPR